MQKNICFIGAGNLATHVAEELQRNGHKIAQVYSRTESAAQALAAKLNTGYTTKTGSITKEADLYFIALKDSVITGVLDQIDLEGKLLIHCSGSLPLSILEKYSSNIGVFYPLQTFSKSRTLDFKKIPVFIEANTKKNEKILIALGNGISGKVSVLESERRKSLHIAAVISCNFVNHFYAIASEYLLSKHISFDVIRPLIEETASKVQEMMPKDAQTGPAIRFDTNIIENHLQELEEFPSYQELYNSISKSIFEYHK